MSAELRDHIVAGRPALLLDKSDSVLHQGTQACAGFGNIGGERRGIHPHPEAVAVVIRHPEQLADHQDRQRVRHCGVQIGGLGAVGKAVQEVGGEFVDPLLHGAEPPGREERLQ